MKQSTFKQTFLSKGKNGEAQGGIVVTMNYTTKNIEGTNAITHDDYVKNKPLHKIEAYVDGKLWDSVLGLDSENMVENEAQIMKEKLEKHLDTISNSEPVKSFVEKMNDLGFKS
jgi:hypothetical protein